MQNEQVLQIIRKGGETSSLLFLQYRDKKGNVTQRYIEPYEVRDDSLFGWDQGIQQIRRFLISNILAISVTPERFTPRFDIKL